MKCLEQTRVHGLTVLGVDALSVDFLQPFSSSTISPLRDCSSSCSDHHRNLMKGNAISLLQSVSAVLYTSYDHLEQNISPKKADQA